MSKEATYQRLKAASASNTPGSLSALVPSAVVQQLQIQLGDLQRKDLELSSEYFEGHPERQKIRDDIAFTASRLDSEVARGIDAVATDLNAAIDAERRMNAALDAETAAAAALARRAVDYDTLKRQVSGDRALYEKLRQRARELTLSGDYDVSSVRVIDRVEQPRAPLPGTRMRNLAGGAAGSLIFAMLLAFATHFVDQRVRSEEDVQTHLGLPSLGAIPRLNGAAIRRRMFHEAMRDLRTQILCSSAEHASRALLVASADVDEGKTLVATHLAMGLAQIGRRVLLVDADLRRPSVHEAFNMPAQPGLSEVLSGAAQPAESVRASSQHNLWVLTAGRPATHPADLLGSGIFDQVMSSLSAAFDTVVIDSPPVMTAADAALVAHKQTSIIFVVSTDRTARRVAQTALDRLDSVGARFVGVVLNRVDADHNAGYYARSHRYSYRETPKGAPAPAKPGTAWLSAP
jgi:succinoglycan biosynthesis transport protein ExoP